MTTGRTLSVEDLRKAAARPESACGLPLVPAGTQLLLRALDARMNSNTVVATVPLPREGEEPFAVLARWLDDGAPGLADAARACDWDGHFEEVRPGPAPWLSALGSKGFVNEVMALLTTSWSPYDVRLEEPKEVLDAFLAAEFPDGLEGWRFFAVDLQSLDVRFDYFDHFGSDRCLLWYDGAVMRVLFTNGSD